MTETGLTNPDIALEEWPPDALDLLRRLNTPEMTEYLGGPETEAKLVERQQRYRSTNSSSTDQMFMIVTLPGRTPVGSAGFWERSWQGELILEMGWCLRTEFQGRGIAVAAVRLALDAARSSRVHRYAHAFPEVGHAASNAVCRRAGFELRGESMFEYPPGNFSPSNDWQLDLRAPSPS
ncbi:MAG: family N-acetyltransferase [Frankiales bacterium]|nr:family N-acetyltransferase [Frankiales bacterium]